MSQIDTDICQAFENLRDFCGQVALMLRTADGLMQKTGWISASKGTTFNESSVALDWPRYWLPTYMSRFYTHPNAPELLVFVSVIVGHPDKPSLVKEAIVSAGWFDHGNSAWAGSWQYTYARAHLFAANKKDDGTLCYRDLAKGSKKDISPQVKKIATFALPLSELSDEASLNTKVICKLITELRAETSASV